MWRIGCPAELKQGRCRCNAEDAYHDTDWAMVKVPRCQGSDRREAARLSLLGSVERWAGAIVNAHRSTLRPQDGATMKDWMVGSQTFPVFVSHLPNRLVFAAFLSIQYEPPFMSTKSNTTVDPDL